MSASHLYFSTTKVLGALALSALTWQLPPAYAQTPAPAPVVKQTLSQGASERARMDWPNLARYRDENAKLAPPAQNEARVVFMGDSITDNWGRRVGRFFPQKPYINRGISGQTTPQMLVRFRQDVIALRPKAVVICAGINDIAGNTGDVTLESIEDNLMSMVDLARANGIRVVLASVTPAKAFGWRAEAEPAEKIRALNHWIEDYARRKRIVYLDYYSALADAEGGLPASLSPDGVHPNESGYAIMAPLADKAIAQALRRRP